MAEMLLGLVFCVSQVLAYKNSSELISSNLADKGYTYQFVAVI